MRLAEFYKNATKPVLSFEVFPPKTDEDYAKLRKLVPRLIGLKPDYMTVTYGAGGTTQGRTLEIAAMIKREYGMEAASHLTCVGASRDELDAYLADLIKNDVRNIVALRGDPPQGEETFKPAPDGLRYGNEMVEHIHAFEKKSGAEPFGIAVAGYPEAHPEAPDMDTDLAYMKKKVDAGVDSIVTQYFFDNADFHKFVERSKALGIDVPIVAGLMPILNGKQIKRFSAMCGATIPKDLLAKLDDAGDDNKKCQAIGVEHCIAQVKDLMDKGVAGIHFYVLNRSSHMTRIMEAIS